MRSAANLAPAIFRADSPNSNSASAPATKILECQHRLLCIGRIVVPQSKNYVFGSVNNSIVIIQVL